MMPTGGRTGRRAGRGARRGASCARLSARGLLWPRAPRPTRLKAIDVGNDADRIEISALGETTRRRGDTLQIETVPGADGVSGRMSVQAVTPGTNPGWFVFALSNTTDKPIERWLAADRYATVGLRRGVARPRRAAHRAGHAVRRLRAGAHQERPRRRVPHHAGARADRDLRGRAGLRPLRAPLLWKAVEYEQKSRDRQLFNGIMLGITGLLAIFLTAVFAANHKAIFPARSPARYIPPSCLR